MFYYVNPLKHLLILCSGRRLSMKNEGKKSLNKEERGDWRLFLQFFKKAKLPWFLIVFVVIVSLAQTRISLMLPGSTAGLFSGDFSQETLIQVILYYLCSAALTAVINYLVLLAESRTAIDLRVNSWKRMMHTKAEFYDQNDPQNLLVAITAETEEISRALINLLTYTIPSISYIVGALLVLQDYHYKLSLVMLVAIPIYGFNAIFWGRWTTKTTYQTKQEVGNLTAYLAERVRNLPLIKYCVTEKKEEEKGNRVINRLYKANMRLSYCSVTSSVYLGLADVAITIISVIVGAMLLRTGEIDMEAWLAFFLFMPSVPSYIGSLIYVWMSIKTTQGQVIRYNRILEAPEEQTKKEEKKSEIPNGDMKLQNVSFAYEDQEILHNLNVTIPSGKVTAIVGPSGSGKTTLLKMLERFYEPTGGELILDGEDIKQFDMQAWRKQISYVQQEAGVFSGSIRKNLIYGLGYEPTESEIQKAIEISGLKSVLEELPNGLETDLSAYGDSISGGQRQRLVIARELLKNAKMILLDEPTSALDVDTASSIADTVLKQFRGKTIVSVTHELNFIAGADQIIVMEKGKVVGQGTHEELMKNCSVYQELVEEQSYQEVYAE